MNQRILSLRAAAPVRSVLPLFLAVGLLAASCSESDSSGGTPTNPDEQSSQSIDNDNPDTDTDTDTEGISEPEESPPPTVPGVPELDKPVWVDLNLVLTPIAELVEPIAFAPRSGFDHLYIGERAGVIRLVERSFNKKGGERISLSSKAVLDITELVSVEGEGGLLGIAFSTDGRFMFVSYTDLAGDLVVAEYVVGRGTRADAETRRELLRVPQPFSNHNGGQLALGVDGFLYIGVGDGGGSYDPDGNGQDPSTLLGTVVRIDTFASGEEAYAIPAGNPFSDQEGGAPEVFLWGVRNPWRFSFDQLTGDLWLPDIGQDTTEEINYLPASVGGGRGQNLGWGVMEGHLPVEGSVVPADHSAPIHVYGHENGRCSVTGGFVYRGEGIPELNGAYLFGDYCSGEIFGLHHVEGVANAWPLSITAPAGTLASFGQALDGEIYVLQTDGQLMRIEQAPPEPEE